VLNETSHHTIPFNKTDKEFESREYKIVKNKVIWSLLRNYFRKTPFYVFLFIYLLASFAFFVRFSYFLIFVLVHVTYVGREPQAMRDEKKNFCPSNLVNTRGKITVCKIKLQFYIVLQCKNFTL